MLMVVTWLWDYEPMAKACESARSKVCCASGGTPVLVYTQSDGEDGEDDVNDVDDVDDVNDVNDKNLVSRL